MLSVSEVERLRSNGVRSLSPGDFLVLCEMALELANARKLPEPFTEEELAHPSSVGAGGAQSTEIAVHDEEELDDE